MNDYKMENTKSLGFSHHAYTTRCQI